MENAVLRSQGLTKRYGSKLALDNLDLTLPEGKIIGLLGPNGSGKTTFIKLAAGLLSPTAGSVTVCGKPIGPDSKAMVSYLPDKTYFNKQQKIRDLLTLFQDFYDLQVRPAGWPQVPAHQLRQEPEQRGEGHHCG